jgi:hypothetical protein
MTREQVNEIKTLVDAAGWDAVRQNKVLWKAWRADRKAAKEYVDKVIDRC